MKQCSKCKKWKPIDKFVKEKRLKGGTMNVCKECRNKQISIWSQDSKWKKRVKEYKLKHHAWVKIWAKNYRESKKGKERDKRYRRKAYINILISSNIRIALKDRKAGRKWEIIVGYTLKDLIKRLEYQFDDKMDWNNWGSYWWIDHKKPKSLFHFISPEDQAFKDCWCLANLQPMEKIANLKKGNRF